MSKKNTKYYVRYVESCTPKLKSFKTESEMNKFIAKFAVETMYGNPDNWIDYAFKGEMLLVDKSQVDFQD